MFGHAAGFQRDGTQMIHATGQHLAAGPHFEWSAFSCQHPGVERGSPGEDDTVRRDFPPGLHGDPVPHLEVGDQDPFLRPVRFESPAAFGRQLDQALQRRLGATKSPILQQLAHQADDQHLGGDQWLPQQDGGEHRDGDRQIGADFSGQQGFQGPVQSTGPADDSGDQGEALAENLPGPDRKPGSPRAKPINQGGPQVGRDQPADQHEKSMELQTGLMGKSGVRVGNLAMHAGDSGERKQIRRQALSLPPAGHPMSPKGWPFTRISQSSAMMTDLTSVYSCKAYSPNSRPIPLIL